MRQQEPRGGRLPTKNSAIVVNFFTTKSHHARAGEDIPTESDTISVLHLRPLVFQVIVLILVHDLRYNRSEEVLWESAVVMEQGLNTDHIMVPLKPRDSNAAPRSRTKSCLVQ